MKCTHCAHEQTGGTFCSECGQPMNAEQLAPTEANTKPVHQPQEVAVKAPPKTEQKEKHQSSNLSLKIDQMTAKIGLYLTVPVLLCLGILAWLLTWLLKSSVFMKDYTYLLFSNTLGISDEVLVELVTQLKVTLWDVLVVAHSATYTAVLELDDAEQMLFSSHIPVVLAPIILGLLIALLHRFIKNRFDLSFKIWLHSLFLGAIAYGLIVAFMGKVLEPTYETHAAVYALTTPLFTLFLKAVFIFFIAGSIGLKLWTFNKTRPSVTMNAIRALRPFFVTLAGGLLGLGIVIILMWVLMHPSEVFTQPLTTPAALWSIYKGDLLFYLLLPTFLFGELLYAIGNSLVVSTTQIGELIQIPNALKLNGITGVTLIGEQEYDIGVLRMIQTATRFIWYAFVFLLVFFFALNRVKADTFQARVTQIIAIGLLFGVIAGAISFKFSSQISTTSGMIGFSAVLTAITTMFITGLFFVGKYVLTDRLKKKAGGQTD